MSWVGMALAITAVGILISGYYVQPGWVNPAAAPLSYTVAVLGIALSGLVLGLTCLFLSKGISNAYFYFLMLVIGIPNGYWSVFIVNAAEQFDAERPAQAGEAGADGERRREHQAHRDAQPARHAGIVDRRPQASTEAGAHQTGLQPDRQRAAQHEPFEFVALRAGARGEIEERLEGLCRHDARLGVRGDRLDLVQGDADPRIGQHDLGVRVGANVFDFESKQIGRAHV